MQELVNNCKMDAFLFTIHKKGLHVFNSDYMQIKLSDNLRQRYNLSFLESKGFTGKIFNSMHDDIIFESVKNQIAKLQPMIIIFSINYLGLSDNFVDSLNLIKKIKKKFSNIHISIEGVYPTLNYNHILKQYNKYIDSIVVGEAEQIISVLLKNLSSGKDFRKISGVAFYQGNKVIKNDNYLFTKDLDTLPFPDRTNINKALERGGVIQIETSRGCGSACNFCYLNAYYEANRACYRRERSVSSVIEEINSVIKKNTVNEIWFSDEDLVGSNKNSHVRAIAIARAMINKKMPVKFVCQISARNITYKTLILLKKARLKRIFVGIESSSQNVLNNLNKGLNLKQSINALSVVDKVGVFCELGFIMFHPFTTIKTILDDVEFLYDNCMKNKKGYIQIYNLNRLIPKPANQEIVNHKKNKIDIFNNEIKLIYLGTSLFSLRIRTLNNLIRKMSLEDDEKVVLKLIYYCNSAILNLLKVLVSCVNSNKNNINKKIIFKVVDQEYTELFNKLNKDPIISKNKHPKFLFENITFSN